MLLEAAGATFNPLHRPFTQAGGFGKELAASCPPLRGKPGEKRSWRMSITLPTSVPIPAALYKPIRSHNSRKHEVCELILNASLSFSFPRLVFIAFQIQPLKKIAFISPQKREMDSLHNTLFSAENQLYLDCQAEIKLGGQEPKRRRFCAAAAGICFKKERNIRVWLTKSEHNDTANEERKPALPCLTSLGWKTPSRPSSMPKFLPN